MGYYNDDVAGLFTGNKRSRGNVAGENTGRRKKRTTGDVAGEFTGRRRKRRTDDVAGTSRGHKRSTGDVQGTFDDNFRVPVRIKNAFIDSDDFCRAVRRCLINDLVAAEQDDDDRKKRRKRR
ncbi:hypothetical protein M3181_15395 [Mesobacillus maritimus]|uniref:hypothetical protein n=1 Tax=Mesobacillus maritimus TaxID=1643336 RepID=UPI00203B96C0|nr:hypothetical protein [Mesobacillus maritimus]MCM3670368.1 hypothetical protein [Mesobacillus maritimus]